VQTSRQSGKSRRAACNCWVLARILREAIAAQELLAKDWGVSANVWSCPSFNELTRDGQDCERHNLLHPREHNANPFVAQQLRKQPARWWRPPTT
jgi:pyruvate dehydrogenase E1 component